MHSGASTSSNCNAKKILETLHNYQIVAGEIDITDVYRTTPDSTRPHNSQKPARYHPYRHEPTTLASNSTHATALLRFASRSELIPLQHQALPVYSASTHEPCVDDEVESDIEYDSSAKMPNLFGLSELSDDSSSDEEHDHECGTTEQHSTASETLRTTTEAPEHTTTTTTCSASACNISSESTQSLPTPDTIWHDTSNKGMRHAFQLATDGRLIGDVGVGSAK
jgi:hypothetical protein